MAYVIYTQYIDDMSKILEFGQDHIAYLTAWENKLLASGGLVDENGKIVGGCITLAVDKKAEAEAFVAGDPFVSKNIVQEVKITRWVQSFFNRKADQEPFDLN